MSERLKAAIGEVMLEEYDMILANANDDHVFSDKFERDMKKLIKRQSRPYYRLINTTAKRVACVIVIMLVISFTAIVSVEAFREAFKDFFINTFTIDSRIIAKTDDNVSYPKKIEDICKITYDLSNYGIDYEEYDDLFIIIIYSKDNKSVFFHQYVVSEYDMNVNTEGSEISSVIIDDAEAIFFCDNNGYYRIIWNNGEYVFDIVTNLGENELIEIANSVEKIEK